MTLARLEDVFSNIFQKPLFAELRYSPQQAKSDDYTLRFLGHEHDKIVYARLDEDFRFLDLHFSQLSFQHLCPNLLKSYVLDAFEEAKNKGWQGYGWSKAWGFSWDGDHFDLWGDTSVCQWRGLHQHVKHAPQQGLNLLLSRHTSHHRVMEYTKNLETLLTQYPMNTVFLDHEPSMPDVVLFRHDRLNVAFYLSTKHQPLGVIDHLSQTPGYFFWNSHA